MADIFSFHGYRYNPSRVNLQRVLTHPYDKITPAMQQKYYDADPHNLIAIEKGCALPGDSPQNNVYTRAAEALDNWIAGGVLVREPAPSFYVYEQEFALPQTPERHVRRGLITLARIEDYSAGIVFRHEQTLAAPKADRLELLRHTRAHTGQLFMLYSDGERNIDSLLEEVVSAPPVMDVADELGVNHRLWPVSESARVARIRTLLGDKTLVIADGHHRYETALTYRNECRARLGTVDRDAAHEKVMITLVNTRSEGLIILPTHRVISNLRDFSADKLLQKLKPYFKSELRPFHDNQERAATYAIFRDVLASQSAKKTLPNTRRIGLYAGLDQSSNVPKGFFVLELFPDADLAKLLPEISAAQRELDVVLLHRFILEKCLGITEQAVTAEKNVTYEREMETAVSAVDSGAAQLCFLLNPVDVEQVVKIAIAGEVMPQKSTDFYPKLLSGVTIYRLE
ncbi:MAG TPA: DUF1015 domain-containing protein [Candidatus Dormibacteraeota bacterium]|nr:DUF1015 domain-containing protein [Candidatus Dormibacteraeota bacterium]